MKLSKLDGVYKRPGIKTIKTGLNSYERCDKHGVIWREGAGFPDACEKCVENARRVTVMTKNNATIKTYK